jgi:hypothetical protein
MKPPFEPFAQGDFDSLCGIHAIINALFGLCPEMTDKHAERLFNRLITEVGTRHAKPLEVVWRGIDGPLLRHLLEIAVKDVIQKHSVKLSHVRFGQQSQRLSIERLLDTLKQRLEAGALAILLFDGESSHWTVAYKITAKKIGLLDSDGRRVIRRTRCTLKRARKHRLIRREIVLISRLPQAIG